MNTISEYRFALVNGRVGYGSTSWDAMINAVGITKASVICDQVRETSRNGMVYAKNGVLIGMVEKRSTLLEDRPL